MAATTLAQKMKLKPGQRVALIGAPAGYPDELGPLISVNDTWSAFSMRPYKPGEARQSFR